MRLVVLGPPRTKKNHQRIIRVNGRPCIVQAKTACAWEESAVLQLRVAMRRAPTTLPYVALPYFVDPVTMQALVYRDRNVGDLLNYLAAVSDALEAAGVVANDRLIVSVDGSRLLIDRDCPRVEIELGPA